VLLVSVTDVPLGAVVVHSQTLSFLQATKVSAPKNNIIKYFAFILFFKIYVNLKKYIEIVNLYFTINKKSPLLRAFEL
jgi:hypothetical protein